MSKFIAILSRVDLAHFEERAASTAKKGERIIIIYTVYRARELARLRSAARTASRFAEPLPSVGAMMPPSETSFHAYAIAVAAGTADGCLPIHSSALEKMKADGVSFELADAPTPAPAEPETSIADVARGVGRGA